MYPVNDVKAGSLPAILAFRLSMLGLLMTERMSAKMAAFDLKPKHVGLLSVLDTAGATAQLDVARVLRVAPSLVVALADHLERRGAIQRLRDSGDRRRQVLILTDAGRDLLQACVAAARELDAELTADLSPADRAAFTRILDQLAVDADLPR
jgi:DNA-binding MarR family transcriptional regulator